MSAGSSLQLVGMLLRCPAGLNHSCTCVLLYKAPVCSSCLFGPTMLAMGLHDNKRGSSSGTLNTPKVYIDNPLRMQASKPGCARSRHGYFTSNSLACSLVRHNAQVVVLQLNTPLLHVSVYSKPSSPKRTAECWCRSYSRPGQDSLPSTSRCSCT
jgi:hypothetical protein